jgi:hypothetical protein
MPDLLRVLGGEEEVMVLMEQGAVESNQDLSLIVVELVGGWLAAHVLVNFDALVVHHNQPRRRCI